MRLGRRAVHAVARDPELPIERAMRPGPSTFRPNVPIEEMAEFMTHHDLPNSPITTSDGRLLGLLVRKEAQEAASELRSRRDAG